jgi:hypothetical protein
MSDTTWPTSNNSQNQYGNPHNLDPNSNQDVDAFWVLVQRGDEMYKSNKYAAAERYCRKVLEKSEKLQI